MIPKKHPRYQSLLTREMIIDGVKRGITGLQGLIAQGRGEAFDYLIGEKTSKSAFQAEKVATAVLLLAEKPVISVNGNVAALIAKDMISLSEILNAPLEVNLFYRTEERKKNIIQYLKSLGARKMYTKSDGLIPGLEHERGKVDKEGILSADVVLVPLEDGDRCKALVNMKKTVIAIDLNPLSRTSQEANITIVDNITRAIPNMIAFAKELKNKKEELLKMIEEFDNQRNLKYAIEEIIAHLSQFLR